MNCPVVSIVLPTYNRARLLKLSIDSVLNQSFQEWELIVIDDSSTDETEYLMNQLVNKDSRIRYLKVPKSNIPGISDYINIGIRASRGKYIARLDDDDTWCHSDKLKLQVEFLDSNPDYVLVGGGVIMMDAGNKELYRYIKRESDKEIRKYALMACPFDHPAIMFRKDTSDLVGGYDKYNVAEDWEFFLKLGKAGKFYNIQEYFVNYLQDGNNISLNNQKETAKTELKIIKLFRNDYPNYYFGFYLMYLQYIYSFFPNFLKKRFQYSIRFLKRYFF